MTGGGPLACSFDLDVNLRKRYPGLDLGNDHVGLHIGMMQLALSITPTTTFWGFCHLVFSQLHRRLSDGEHFLYHTANRVFDWGNEEYTARVARNHGHANDLNFSNIGPYPFPPEYGADTRVTRCYCVGSRWCPFFGGYVFLIHSLTELNYSFVYEVGNEVTATKLFAEITKLVECAATLPDDFAPLL